MKTKEKEIGGKIKTFLAEKKPKSIKVFQFTKEMLPEIDFTRFDKTKYLDSYKQTLNKMNFLIYCNKIIICAVETREQNAVGQRINRSFEVGDYIGEDREGNSFVIKKEEFNRDWVVVK